MRNFFSVKSLRVFLVGRDVPETRKQVALWADRFPNDGGLNRLAGINFVFAHDDERALQYFSQAQVAGKGASDSMTSYWLGKTYEHSGDYANAIATMYQAGNDEYFPVLPADISDEEIEDLAQGLRGQSVSARACFELAKRVYNINTELAQHYFELAFRTAPETWDYSLGTAWFLLDHGDFQTARIFGERARSQFPGDPWLYLFFGNLDRATRDFDQAVQDLERVIEISPTGNLAYQAHLQLGLVYNLREEYDVAIEHLEVASQMQGEPLFVHLNLAHSYAGLQQCTVARDQLDIAVSLIETERQQDIYRYSQQIVDQNCP